MDRFVPPPRSAIAAADSRTDPVVFLSYAHEEQAIALPFRDALASRGLYVLIDVEHLKPGDDIADFARRSIRKADATICLASTASLSSAWVVFEAVAALDKERDNPAARLIACATDRAFFHPEFRLAITRSLDERLALINQTLQEYLIQDLDMKDLSQERSRLMGMRASLGDVLDRLRNSLTLVLQANELIEPATRIADHIRNLKGQPPSTSDPRDTRARAEELRRYLWDGQTDVAMGLLLQFVQEFSDQPKHLRDAVWYSNTLRRIATAEREDLSFGEAEAQRQPTIYKILELIDDMEAHPRLLKAS